MLLVLVLFLFKEQFTKDKKHYMLFRKACENNTFVSAYRHLSGKGRSDEKLAKVILLSLENAASGTNLTAASHVCLIDRVASSATEAYASERQAIGRLFAREY